MEITNMAEARRVLELTLGEYSAIRGDMWAKIYDAVWQYLTTGGNVTEFKQPSKQAIATTYVTTGDLAWLDGGGSLPLDEDAAGLVASSQSAELGFIDQTATRLQLLKKDEEAKQDWEATYTREAFAVADGYASTLDALYANIKVMAAGSKMLTFTGTDGVHTCKDCARYQGKRHKASWWVSHNAIPPNRSFECGGYKCEHILVDDNGNLFTI
jgi:hypothetical protein